MPRGRTREFFVQDDPVEEGLFAVTVAPTIPLPRGGRTNVIALGIADERLAEALKQAAADFYARKEAADA